MSSQNKEVCEIPSNSKCLGVLIRSIQIHSVLLGSRSCLRFVV